jgi:hypothetical protein
MDNTEYKIGESVVLRGQKYIVSALSKDGAYILKTPYEIRREQNARHNIKDEVLIDGVPHFITEIVNDKFTLKTFQEIYDESCCKGCKSLCKDKGWKLKDRVRLHAKMPNVFGCRFGQFAQTYNVIDLKKQCKFKNYVYKPREEVRKGIEKIMSACPIKMDSLSKIMRPIDPYGVLGIEVIDAEKECVTIRHAKNFGNLDWDRK